MQEIEKKYFIDDKDIDKIINNIKKAGCKFVSKTSQKDIYFNVPFRDSIKTKECLRIRESVNIKEITYKPPTKAKDDSLNHFSKKEVNLKIENVDIAEELLVDIGCKKLATVKKNRDFYTLDKVNILVDYVESLGYFIEIEYLGDEDVDRALNSINSVVDAIGLNEFKTEDKPYRDLIIEKEDKHEKS